MTQSLPACPATQDLPEVSKGICRGCGYTGPLLQGRVQCPRNHGQGCRKDHRRNTSQVLSWRQSETGRKWLAWGCHFLPKDTSITLVNTTKLYKDTNSTSSQESSGRSHLNSITGKHTRALDSKTSKNIDMFDELIPFSLCNVQPKRKRGSGNSKPDSGVLQSASHSLLLETGALGANVVSLSFLAMLIDNKINFKMSNTHYDVTTATNDTTISNKLISFTIYSKSEPAHKQNRYLTLQINAIVAHISLDLILDRSTIKKYNLISFSQVILLLDLSRI